MSIEDHPRSSHDGVDEVRRDGYHSLVQASTTNSTQSKAQSSALLGRTHTADHQHNGGSAHGTSYDQTVGAPAIEPNFHIRGMSQQSSTPRIPVQIPRHSLGYVYTNRGSEMTGDDTAHQSFKQNDPVPFPQMNPVQGARGSIYRAGLLYGGQSSAPSNAVSYYPTFPDAAVLTNKDTSSDSGGGASTVNYFPTFLDGGVFRGETSSPVFGPRTAGTVDYNRHSIPS